MKNQERHRANFAIVSSTYKGRQWPFAVIRKLKITSSSSDHHCRKLRPRTLSVEDGRRENRETKTGKQHEDRGQTNFIHTPYVAGTK